MTTLPETIYTDLKSQIPALTEALKEGASWGTDLAHRFIVYDIWVNAISGALALLVILGLVGLSVWLLKKRKGWEAEAEPWNKDGVTMGIMLAVPTLLIIIIFLTLETSDAISNIIKDIFIPELRIIEVLQDNFDSSPTLK